MPSKISWGNDDDAAARLKRKMFWNTYLAVNNIDESPRLILVVTNKSWLYFRLRFDEEMNTQEYIYINKTVSFFVKKLLRAAYVLGLGLLRLIDV